ncbi:MAG: AAA family ATPase [Candidatus Heimdallarchaeota archaeon]
MDNLIIIGVTGLPSAGKGLFCDIARKYGFKQIIMGDVIRNECHKRGLPVNRESSNKVMIDLRREGGENAVAIITLDWIRQAIISGHNLILIDGIRSLSEVKTFRNEYQDFNVISIHASQKTRLKRAMQRRRRDDAFSKQAFIKRDNIELNIGIGDVIAKSDILISSESVIGETRDAFREVISYLIKQKKIEIEIL